MSVTHHHPRLFELAKKRRPGQDIDAQIVAAGLPVAEPEFRFSPARRWRFDFAWPLFKIALEIEGGAHGRLIVIERGYERRKGSTTPIKAGTRLRVGGRHQSGPGLEADCVKYSTAAALGWCVIRATTTQVRDGIALELLRQAFTARGLE